MDDLYVDIPGDIVFSQDFKHSHALSYHYIIRANPLNLQALCDSWLNVLWQSKYRFSPYGPFLLVTFVNSSCHLGGCTPDEWSTKGCGNRGCAHSMLYDRQGEALGGFKFNLLSINMLVEGMGRKPVLFSPYTFCDNGIVCANYRERLGWNLLFSELTFPLVEFGTPPECFAFRCDMDVPRTKTFLEAPPLETFVELNAPDAFFRVADDVSFRNGADALARMGRHLYAQFSGRQAGGDTQYIAALSQAMLGGVSRMTLRQFRGTITGEKAILQSIQSFDYGDYNLREGGIMGIGHQIQFPKISAVANLHFPMKEDLGLDDEADIWAGFWTLPDYSMTPTATTWSGIRKD